MIDIVRLLRADHYEQDTWQNRHTKKLQNTAGDEIERLRALVEMGIKMRDRQKAYFKSRTKDDLIASKQAEAAFDRATKEG